MRIRTVVYDWPYKYIASSDGCNELYDVEKDQQETTNLAEVEKNVAARLAKGLKSFQVLIFQPGEWLTLQIINKG